MRSQTGAGAADTVSAGSLLRTLGNVRVWELEKRVRHATHEEDVLSQGGVWGCFMMGMMGMRNAEGRGR